jgi:hypothetical protein
LYLLPKLISKQNSALFDEIIGYDHIKRLFKMALDWVCSAYSPRRSTSLSQDYVSDIFNASIKELIFADGVIRARSGWCITSWQISHVICLLTRLTRWLAGTGYSYWMWWRRIVSETIRWMQQVCRMPLFFQFLSSVGIIKKVSYTMHVKVCGHHAQCLNRLCQHYMTRAHAYEQNYVSSSF